MGSDLHARDEFVVGDAGVTGPAWMGAFDQHIPARVLSAVSFADGFVVLSGESGITAEISSAVVARLREAGFDIATATAPLPGLSVLHDLIHDAIVAGRALEQPLLVIVERAENLSMQIVQRLVTLAELRQDGRPVLRFLLTGTPALWPMLRSAGLGRLENDAAAHVRLMPDLIRCLTVSPQAEDGHPHGSDLPHFDPAMAEPTRRGQASPSRRAIVGAARSEAPRARSGNSRIRHRAALAIVGLTLTGMALAGGAATWVLLTPRPDRSRMSMSVAPPSVVAPVLSPDDRLAALLDRENREIAADRPLPGDDLIETRRQIDEILPKVSSGALHALTAHTDSAAGKPADIVKPASGSTAAPDAGRQVTQAAPPPSSPGPAAASTDASAPAASASGASEPVGVPAAAPTRVPLHVTLHYSHGDRAAAAKAANIGVLLRAKGVPVDGPLALGQAVEQSSLAYYFTQDQVAALELAQQLSPRMPQIHKLPPMGSSPLPRPGEISISVGSS